MRMGGVQWWFQQGAGMRVSKGVKRILQGKFQKSAALMLVGEELRLWGQQPLVLSGLPHSHLPCESQFPGLCNTGGAGGDQAGCKD